VKIGIPYGGDSCTVEVSGVPTRVVPPLSVPPVRDLGAAIERGLAAPEGGKPLREILRGRRDAVIVFSDRTRKYPADEIITALARSCNEAGIPDERIILLCGGGAHRENSLADCRRIVGEENAERFPVLLHDARRIEECTRVGVTSFGTPVWVNKAVVEASCVITTGVILPHYYAGFSGGRKSILPGVSAEETILRNHSLNFHGTARGRNPRARTAVLKGNPVHEDMVEGARMTGVDFIVNVTMDEHGKEVTGVFCGDLEAAHEKGCSFYLEHYRRNIPRGACDLVIAGAGGHPKDHSLYQAHKAFDNLAPAVREGGIVVLAARCGGGFGKENFREWLHESDLEDMEKRLRHTYRIEGHTAYCFKRKLERVRLFLVSELEAADVEKIGCTPFADLEEAVKEAVRALKGKGSSGPECLVVPHADAFLL